MLEDRPAQAKQCRPCCAERDFYPSVWIIILNWNNAPDTLACLESVLHSDYPHFRLLVVDNGSTDGSVAAIRQHYPAIEVLALPENLGYAEGNNIGIRRALAEGAELILLLNNDVILAENTISSLVSVAQAIPDGAFFGPKVLDRERPNVIQSAGGQLDMLWRTQQRGLCTSDDGRFNGVEEVDYLIGAAILIRACTLSHIGLLDPEFYLYKEDVDWCLRARRLGYQVVFVPSARVWHRSHNATDRCLPRITYYMTRNGLWLVAKHGGGLWRLSALMLRHLLTALSWSIKPQWRHKRAERDALIKGIWDFVRHRMGRGWT